MDLASAEVSGSCIHLYQITGRDFHVGRVGPHLIQPTETLLKQSTSSLHHLGSDPLNFLSTLAGVKSTSTADEEVACQPLC